MILITYINNKKLTYVFTFYDVKLKVCFDNVHFCEVKLNANFDNVHFYEVKLKVNFHNGGGTGAQMPAFYEVKSPVLLPSKEVGGEAVVRFGLLLYFLLFTMSSQ